MFAFTIGSRSKDIERQDYTLKLNVQRANTWRCKHRMQTMLMHSSKKRVQQSKQRTVKQALRTLRTRPLLLLQQQRQRFSSGVRCRLQRAPAAVRRPQLPAPQAMRACLRASHSLGGRGSGKELPACLPACWRRRRANNLTANKRVLRFSPSRRRLKTGDEIPFVPHFGLKTFARTVPQHHKLLARVASRDGCWFHLEIDRILKFDRLMMLIFA